MCAEPILNSEDPPINMSADKTKTVCGDIDKILKEFAEKQKKRQNVEKEVLSSLLKDKEFLACIPTVSKQLEDDFGISLNQIIANYIREASADEKPVEHVIPTPEAGEMRGYKKIIESAKSVSDLTQKLEEAKQTLHKVYSKGTPKDSEMISLWTKRLNTARDNVLKKLEKNHTR